MARAVVFLIVGGYVAQAGWQANPQQVVGTDEIWNFLSNQAYGQILMVLMVLGLVSYGVYNILEARLGRIDVI